MQCPVCGCHDTRVIDSRPADANSAIRRRRSCPTCDHRFTTYERSLPVLAVRKRNGRVEPFSPAKLRAGIVAALANRPVDDDDVDDLIEEIEAAAANGSGTIESTEIGRRVLESLRRLDEVAYLRFASVHKEFKVGSDFERELAELETSPADLAP